MGTPNLAQGLLARIQSAPEYTAVVSCHADREFPISARHFVQNSLAFSKHFQNMDIQPGQIVVDLLPPGEDLLFAFWGAVFQGAVPSILPFRTEKLDPARYYESLQSLIEVTNPAALVAGADLAQEIKARLPLCSSLKIITPDEVDSVAAQNLTPDGFPGVHILAHEIALLQHSSGTTGLQKGVALSHQAVFNQIKTYEQVLSITSDDVIVSWLPLYHDMGLIAGFLLPLLTWNQACAYFAFRLGAGALDFAASSPPAPRHPGLAA